MASRLTNLTTKTRYFTNTQAALAGAARARSRLRSEAPPVDLQPPPEPTGHRAKVRAALELKQRNEAARVAALKGTK